MKKLSIFILAFVLLVSLSCSRIKKSDAEFEREEWISGFTDSIEYYQARNSEVDRRLNEINSRLSDMLQNFEYIKNPREVSGYYLLNGWKSRLPFTTTAVYARINEYEKLEIIATLAGSTFNQIAVGTGHPEYYSEVVPHDQAFNFRHDRFNSVYFSGGKTDTIAEYISNHFNDKVNLEFLEGKVKKNFAIPADEKEMIHKTWQLFNTQREARALQKELWICSKKIETFRRILHENNKEENN